jgi:hypothetical protein
MARAQAEHVDGVGGLLQAPDGRVEEQALVIGVCSDEEVRGTRHGAIFESGPELACLCLYPILVCGALFSRLVAVSCVWCIA